MNNLFKKIREVFIKSSELQTKNVLEKQNSIDQTQENTYQVKFQAVKEQSLENECIITYGQEEDE